jgi:hypothetical protein
MQSHTSIAFLQTLYLKDEFIRLVANVKTTNQTTAIGNPGTYQDWNQ